MTTPEKEFELKPGSYASYNGSKALIYAFSNSGLHAAIEMEGYGRVWADTADLKPWKPDHKPKSFADERESLAREVEGTEFFNCSRSQIAAKIRALQPDAPAAAIPKRSPALYVAKGKRFAVSPSCLRPSEWGKYNAQAQSLYQPAYTTPANSADEPYAYIFDLLGGGLNKPAAGIFNFWLPDGNDIHNVRRFYVD